MLRQNTAQSLQAAIQQLLSKKPQDKKYVSRHVVARRDGRHILEPEVCSMNGLRWQCKLTDIQTKELHNEGGHPAQHYPLSIAKELFFSEGLAVMNAAADDYQKLAIASIKVVAKKMRNGVLPFSVFEEVGNEIQTLDAKFAKTRINKPLDHLHKCMGPDPAHPYSKTTILRTSFPVDTGGKIINFYFEKFLVSYSYLNHNGHRCSTVTPIHSHPLNFETIYFTAYGSASHALEQEFYLTLETGEMLVQNDGSLHPKFVKDILCQKATNIRLKSGPTESLTAGPEPIILQPFDSENAFKSHSELITATDGLFRPHRVTVVDDPEKETRYFALDNYFGPTGRVFLYDDDGQAKLWSHAAWD
jgi:hypothetical protein